MIDTVPSSAPHSFPALKAEFDTLQHLPRHEAVSGHCPIGSHGTLWLSTDPQGLGRLTMVGTGSSASLVLEQGDSGKWASLGFQLVKPALQKARHFALLITVSDTDLAICTPTLRYKMKTGHIDHPAEPLVMTLHPQQAPQTYLTHVPLDSTLLSRCEGCEFNLFFQTDNLKLQIHQLDPAIMY